MLLVGKITVAQIKIGNNPNLINPSSLLEIESSTKGFLTPRMTTLQRNSIASPASGLLIFNTTNNRMEMNTGSTSLPNWTSMDAEHLTNISLLGNSSPLGSTIGQLMYNTNAASGIAEGPVYWDGNKWIALKPSTVNTVYNSDDVLTGNRTISQSNYSLNFSGTGKTLFNAGSVGVGTNSPDESALVDISSTAKGFLLPRLSQSQRDAIVAPAQGLMVYCTDCNPLGLYLNNGSPTDIKWQIVGSSGSGTGNITCSGAVVSGTYTQGVAMASSNYITLPVNVVTTGTYTASSNKVNGISFSGGGIFTSPGSSNITLFASGGSIPVNSGIQTYAISLGSSICNVSVNFTAAAADVTSLDCTSGATATPTLITATSVPAGFTFSIPYTGGNGFSFSGSFVSTTHPGLTATAAPQTLSPSGGTLVFTVTGTPSADGTITFPITLGSSSCNYTGMTASTGITLTAVSSGTNVTVPVGISKAVMKVWGAAGNSLGGYFGGYGGFVSGTVTVTSGETLIARVGQGGQPSAAATNGGGMNGGGGYSGIFRSSMPILIAGGGGGTGQNDEVTTGRECSYVYGGSAGVSTGMAGGRHANGASAMSGYDNTGGSQIAGGTGSDGTNGGSALQGGAGFSGGAYRGGGGGGGLFGGGGGTNRSGTSSGDDGGGGGAGGSNYVAGSGITAITNSAQTVCVSNSSVAAPGSTDSDYNVALTPAKPRNRASGSNGMIVIKWSY